MFGDSRIANCQEEAQVGVFSFVEPGAGSLGIVFREAEVQAYKERLKLEPPSDENRQDKD